MENEDPYEGESSSSSYKPSDCNDSDSTYCSDMEEQRGQIVVTAEIHEAEEKNDADRSGVSVQRSMRNESAARKEQRTKKNKKTLNTITSDPGDTSVEVQLTDRINIIESEKRNVRKKMRTPKAWKVNILKEKHQTGQEYINSKGKYIPPRNVKNLKDCLNSCKFKCGQNVTDSERLGIFTGFYKLTQNEKHLFILNTTERKLTARPSKNIEHSHKKFSFQYFCTIHNDRIQVCKKYYLGTLAISQKPIYNAHNNKDGTGNIPKPDTRGQNSSRRISTLRIQGVKDHINSFPRVESHYCRSSTKREYLDSSLSLQKMYELYCEFCNKLSEPTEPTITPVKFSMYRYLFNTEFNLSFHKRKTDRCDLCEEYNVANKQKRLSDELKQKYLLHISNKDAMRQERTKDRANIDIPILCFDLQNVITLPRADISSFFYKRKLNVYNLTAHLSTSKTIYCALWSECNNGRGGNEIASAFKKILDKVAEEHNITKLITWSDSCIPQNRNSFISTAVLNFMNENPQMIEVIMKYSTPGHSCIQEVDNAHSAIEKAMARSEIYSLIGVIRILKSLNTRKPLRVIQMTPDDFRDYGSVAKTMSFKLIPFLNVCSLKFNQNINQAMFLESFRQPLYKIVNLRSKERPKRKILAHEINIDIKANVYKKQGFISNEKKNDLMSMLKYMPQQDQVYFKTLLK